MRPFFVSTAVVLLTVAAFGQQPVPRPNGACFYGCGPSIPLLTTPMLTLETVSPNPVGASNATTGLIAGATNSTLSEINGSTSSVYTEAVWTQGGSAPLLSSQVNLAPEALGRDGHIRHEMLRESMRAEMREEMREDRGREAMRESFRQDRGREKDRNVSREEHATEAEARPSWIYLTEPAPTHDTGEASTATSGTKKATHVYTNEDVQHENDKNGTVKYDGKTEKM
jgi:hypothetical protein